MAEVSLRKNFGLKGASFLVMCILGFLGLETTPASLHSEDYAEASLAEHLSCSDIIWTRVQVAFSKIVSFFLQF